MHTWHLALDLAVLLSNCCIHVKFSIAYHNHSTMKFCINSAKMGFALCRQSISYLHCFGSHLISQLNAICIMHSFVSCQCYSAAMDFYVVHILQQHFIMTNPIVYASFVQTFLCSILDSIYHSHYPSILHLASVFHLMIQFIHAFSLILIE